MESFKNISKHDIFDGVITPEIFEQCPLIYRHICYYSGACSISYVNGTEYPEKVFRFLKLLSNIIDNPVAVSRLCLWNHTWRLGKFTNRVYYTRAFGNRTISEDDRVSTEDTENAFAVYENVIHSHFWKWKREKILVSLGVFLKERRRIIVQEIIEPELNVDVTRLLVSYL